MRRRLALIAALGSVQPALAEPAQWRPLPAASTSSPGGGSPWQPLPTGSAAGPAQIQWQQVPQPDASSPGSAVRWQPLPPSSQSAQPPEPPTSRTPSSSAEAEALLNSLAPTAADYPPLLRLGPAVPTANQLGEQQAQLSAYVLSPFGGGAASGSGNQNYAVQVDAGLTDSVQLSGFYTNADDPLFAPIQGAPTQPGNFWESYGGALQWQLLNSAGWKLALAGSLEGWNVGSGGCDSFSCKGQNTQSPNIFNSSGSRVFTKNLVGSIRLPLSWQLAPQWQVSFTPGVSLLPASQGAGQGGAGTFYGTNSYVSAGLSWQPSRHLSLFSSALLPLGPGNNSFNSSLVFARVPIFSGGLTWALNPRIGLEGLLTNGWGATPATALLTVPSSNQLGYLARFVYTPGAADTPQSELSPRRRSLAMGGLTVNTALVPPSGVTQLWANADSGGNLFGYAGYSLSNIFQLEVLKAGTYNNVPQTSTLTNTYFNSGAPQLRFGGKAVSLSPLRGFPLWVAGRISLGREMPPGSGQGYTFGESILTWEANNRLAVHLNPKLAWSGVSTPWGFGIGANLQLGSSFQLIPEANVVASEINQSNASLGLRWLASKSLQLDLYVSNAAGLLDMGQLIRLNQARIGGRLNVVF